MLKRDSSMEGIYEAIIKACMEPESWKRPTLVQLLGLLENVEYLDGLVRQDASAADEVVANQCGRL